jgi:hypothetical protein
VALVAVALLVLPRPARADDAQAWEYAKSPFDNGQYMEAHGRLSALLDLQLPPCDSAPPASLCHLSNRELIERARALDAASLLALKRDAEADRLIATILKANPLYVPNPDMFPQQVVDRFNRVRISLAAELQSIQEQRARELDDKNRAAQKAHDDLEKWIGDLEKRAAREKRVEPNSRWIALVPFGIGQIQNGDLKLGIFFGVGEAVFGGTSLAMVPLFQHYASFLQKGMSSPSLKTALDVTATVNRISFGTWAALTLVGVIQAQVAFVPERVTYRDRPIPPRPKVAPVAGPVPHGAVFGLGGTF